MIKKTTHSHPAIKKYQRPVWPKTAGAKCVKCGITQHFHPKCQHCGILLHGNEVCNCTKPRAYYSSRLCTDIID